jgi:hypothetical protein
MFNNLRGRSLTRLLGVVGALAFTLQGYDQAVANGLLTLRSFLTTFPSINTTSKTLSPAQISHNSTIQGMCATWKFGNRSPELESFMFQRLMDLIIRYCCRPV